MRKLGEIQKGLNEKLEEQEAELEVEGKDDWSVTGANVYSEIEMVLGAMTNATWLVWVPMPEPAPIYPFRNVSNCSHWAWEMGH